MMCESYMQGPSLEAMVVNAEKVELELIEAIRSLEDYEQAELLLHILERYGNKKAAAANTRHVEEPHIVEKVDNAAAACN